MPRFEKAGTGRFWEIEQDEVTVRWCSGVEGDKVKRGEETFADEDEAFHAAGLRVRKQRRLGFAWAGPSRVLAGGEPTAPAGSSLLLAEHFTAGDPRFDAELRRSTTSTQLASLAEPWYRDRRPWARARLLAYIDDGCGRPFHKPLVKRLFKLAEAAGDDEAIAHFVVAFDRLTRRSLVTERRWDPSTRAAEAVAVLRPDPTVPHRLTHPISRQDTETSPFFSRVTRRYLARRAGRYLRQLGHRDLERYRRAALIALPLYRDSALASPTRLLDAWGLVHLLYGRSPVLDRRPSGIRLADGRTLAELRPAPQFPAAWRDRFDELWALLLAAQSRTVRSWTIAWLRDHHGAELARLDLPAVARLLHASAPDLRTLGAELLPRAHGVERAPIEVWLELLAIDDLDVVPAIVAAVERHVAPARLTLAQCAALAGARVAAVARLGLAWARTKPISTAGDLRMVARLAGAGVAEVRTAATTWALSLLDEHPADAPTLLRDLCDAPHADARALALAAVVASERHASSPALWFALAESPHDDVRAVVLAHSRRWQEQAPPETLRHVWTSAVLAVHRGSKSKQRVPRALAERVVGHPDEADELLPVLALALRSVRAPERAAALAALARAIHRDPALRERARTHLPELAISGEVSS